MAGAARAWFWGACLSTALLSAALRAQPVPGEAAAGVAMPVPAQIRVPSLDRVDGQALLLSAHWFPVVSGAEPGTVLGAVPGVVPGVVPGARGPRPALVLMHGCGGAFDRQGRLSLRMREYSALLNGQGWSVLVLDSFGARGATQICTQKLGTRAVTMTQRRRDALGALAWLAHQPGVDAQRLALLGWSNGGSAVLAATNRQHAEVASAATSARAAVAFYPGCESDLRAGYTPSAALLLLVGEADDWTPAAACEALVRSAAAAPATALPAPAAPAAPSASGPAVVPAPQISVFPGAFHGFDGVAPVALRSDVPNGVHPGAGVHVGGQPEARAASRSQMLEFLRAALR